MRADDVDPGGLDAGFSSTKKQILVSLKREGRISLTDLAAELNVSKMAVLKHMGALEAKGLVERSFEARARGRPRVCFSLSKDASPLFPEAYTHMTLCALSFIEEKLGRPAVVQLLKQRTQAVYAANEGRFADRGFGDKVRALVGLREEGGYMAEPARIGASSAEILEHNCPILAIAERYGEACEVEVDLFQKLLRADVEASHRVVAGDPVCRFLIRTRREFRA